MANDNRVKMSPVAIQVPFDNSTNGFTSTEVQSAIEEARQNAQGFPRAGIRATVNSTVSNNQWIGPSELHPNTPLMVAPVKLEIKEITWSNELNNVQFQIQFRLNSKTGPIFYTLTVNSPNNGSGYVTGVDYILNPGDRVFAQYIDTGLNASDLDLMLWVRRVP